MYESAIRRTKNEKLSQGASNAFFFETEDETLIIKSVTKAECAKLRKILRAYSDHVRSHPGTQPGHLLHTQPCTRAAKETQPRSRAHDPLRGSLGAGRRRRLPPSPGSP